MFNYYYIKRLVRSSFLRLIVIHLVINNVFLVQQMFRPTARLNQEKGMVPLSPANP